MAEIIRRTNPDRRMSSYGEQFVCSSCGTKWSTFEEGKDCAVADFARRDKEIRLARRRARYAQRVA